MRRGGEASWRWAVIVAACSLSLAACLETPTFFCLDRLCPKGTVCDEARQTCLLQEQVDACIGRDELARCSYSGVSDGRCLSGACFAVGCGNGAIDHEDEVCDDGNNASGDGCSADCRSDESCGNGILDSTVEEACDDGNTSNQDGCNEVCLKEECGNAYIDFNEVCDDGNIVAADGCSADCLSLETCGNGYEDLLTGLETCDDGENSQHNDGCSDACIAELPTWTREWVEAPVARSGAALAYDAHRGRALLFGGRRCAANNSDCLLDDTWVFEGGAWRELSPNNAPAPRTSTMIFDSRRGIFVLLGGQGVAGAGADPGLEVDTWHFDGRDWSAQQTFNPPGLRSRTGHAMAYDRARDRVVMYGGRRTSPVTATTFEYDGADWAVGAAANMSPPTRFGHAMAYDPRRGVIVMFGGRYDPPANPGPASLRNDTWEYNGTWTQATVPSPPPARTGHSMVYDPVRETVVMFGGQDANGNAIASGFEWDGTAWTALPVPTPSPSPRTNLAATYDIAHEQLLLFGGEQSSTYLSQLWSSSTDDSAIMTWVLHQEPETPPALTAHSMAYDSRRGVIVLFGGQEYISDGVFGVPKGRTWEYDGFKWTFQTIDEELQGWLDHDSAYNPLTGETVVAGGRTLNPATTRDVWVWLGDGLTDWEPLAPTPTDTHHGAVAFFAPTGEVVVCDDDRTFSWDGEAWTTESSVLSGTRFVAVYDSVRRRVVAVAGSLGSTFLWDGTAWTDAAPNTAAPKRRLAAAAFDGSRGTTILFGGQQGGGILYAETWEYDHDDSWHPLETIGVPGPRAGHAMAYHAARRKSVLFGGGGPDSSTADTWSFRYVGTREDEVCTTGHDVDGDGLVACDDPDCWGYCAPSCPPAAMTAGPCDEALPHCGDGVCDPIEDSRVCIEDCGARPERCGDLFCEGAETLANCPGDCTP